MAKEKIAFIINPKSGLHIRQNVAATIESLFSKTLFDIQIYFTKKAGDATFAARGFQVEGFDRVIAVGGDGTVNEVARGLVGTHTALGIIPFGSGNGLARHLNIPLKVEDAIFCIMRNKRLAIDYGIYNHKPFFCTAGVGFDALISHRFATKKVRGVASYIQEIITQFALYERKYYRITLDHKVIERRAVLVTIANGSQWGNNAIIAPQANICDGKLDVVIITEIPPLMVPEVALMMFTGNFNLCRLVESYQCSSVKIECEEADYTHFDGEAAEITTQLDFHTVHKGLTVIL